MRERPSCLSSLSHLALALALALHSGCYLETEGTGKAWPESSEDDEQDTQGPVEDATTDPSVDDDSGTERDDAGDRVADADASVARNECGAPGVFGVRVDFDVTWQGTSFVGIVPVIAPGAGQLRVYAAASFAKSGFKQATIKACGAEIPAFEAGQNVFAGELYGVHIPEPSWDRPSMPTWSLDMRPTCTQPGCAFDTGLLEVLLGTRQRDIGGRGPRRRPVGPRIESVDDDGDGQLGMTLLTLGPNERHESGRAYVQPPLGNWFSRAQRLMLAIAVNAQLRGKFDHCDALSGSVQSGAVLTSALGCTSTSNGVEVACDSGAVQFLDENLPAWTVSSASFKGVRVSADDCTAIRAALAP